MRKRDNVHRCSSFDGGLASRLYEAIDKSVDLLHNNYGGVICSQLFPSVKVGTDSGRKLASITVDQYCLALAGMVTVKARVIPFFSVDSPNLPGHVMLAARGHECTTPYRILCIPRQVQSKSC